MTRLPLKHVLICNGAKRPKGVRESATVRIHHLDHEKPPKNSGRRRNVRMELPDLVLQVDHLPDRLLDLMEIATYVYAADRSVSRGENDSLVMDAWSRNMHLVTQVRDDGFWNRDDVKRSLSDLLRFMSGDREWRFTFQPGRQTQRAGIFDKPGVARPSQRPTKVMLFSGGLDSLAGAAGLLRNSTDSVLLVTHRSGDGRMQKTQDDLFRELRELFPRRVEPVSYRCGLSTMAIDESQRTRGFLYLSLAFAVATAVREGAVYAFENGVTAISMPEREFLLNARASRTAHPKSLAGAQALFSLVSQSSIQITNPFLWKTKTDVVRHLWEAGVECLLNLSISCGVRRSLPPNATHCGVCSQCIDRRLAVYGAGLGRVDDASQYGKDFVTDVIADKRGTATGLLLDFLKTSREFQDSSRDEFYIARLPELTEVVDFVGEDDEAAVVDRLHELHRLHGRQITHAVHGIGVERAGENGDTTLARVLGDPGFGLPAPTRFRELAAALRSVPIGAGRRYEVVIKQVLEAIFDPFLWNPQEQEPSGPHILDIVFTIGANFGFFQEISQDLKSRYVLFECKNYGDDPGNPAVDQLCSTMGSKQTGVGFVVHRKWRDRDRAIERCQYQFRRDRMAMVLDDDDLSYFLDRREHDDYQAIWKRLDDQRRRLVLH